MAKKKLYIIAGANGSGKSTSAKAILPNFLSVNRFINADEIAKGLSPLKPSLADLEAGKLMLKNIRQLIKKEENFAFETTLASKIFVKYIERAKKLDYEINLIFLWIKDTGFAQERVKLRVSQGGHDIPTKDIIRKYKRGLKNLFNLYWDIVDNLFVYNSNTIPPQIIFEKNKKRDKIHNTDTWNNIKNYYEK